MTRSSLQFPAGAAALALALFAPALAGQETLLGSGTPDDGFGEAVAGVGDVDADGFEDLLVGAHRDGTNGPLAGRAYVFSGASLRAGAPPPPLRVLSGDVGDQFGRAVAAIGDVDGDGHADLLIGAPFASLTNPPDGGSVHVISGRDFRELFRLDGPVRNGRFGWSVDGGGDLNGDGYPDVVVGAPRDDTVAVGAGSVSVFSGRDGTLLRRWYGDAADDQLGFAVAFAGDLDGDGHDDVVAGAPTSDWNGTDAGYLRAFSGRTGGILYERYGAAGDELGHAVAGDFDADADGSPDLAAGRPGAAMGVGAAIVIVGPLRSPAVRDIDGPATARRCGVTVDVVRYTNPDTAAELLVGALDRLLVVAAATGNVVRTLTHDPLGSRVSASSGDIDGDGRPNLFHGLPDPAGSRRGAVEIERRERREAIDGSGARAMAGAALRFLGDLDGDGMPELAIGEPERDQFPGLPIAAGGVLIRYGDGRVRDLPQPPQTGTEFWANQGFGTSIEPLGDIDGDGIPDVAVGAPQSLYGNPMVPFGQKEHGLVHIFSGATLARLRTLRPADPNVEFQEFGATLAFVPGLGLVVGAPAWQGGRGKIEAIDPRDGRFIDSYEGSSGERLGAALRSTGERSLAVGLPGLGWVSRFAYEPTLGGFIPVGAILGSSGFGSSIELLDFDGDGLSEFVIGNPVTNEVTIHRVFLGLLVARFSGAPDERFGSALSVVLDRNGDGREELLIGAPGSAGLPGYALLIAPQTATILERFDGAAPDDRRGAAVAGTRVVPPGARDLPLFAIGAPGADVNCDPMNPQCDRGQVTLVSGWTTGLPAAVPFGGSCAASDGRRPRIHALSAPQLGRSFEVGLGTAPRFAPAYLLVGLGGRRQLPFGSCFGATTGDLFELTGTDEHGRAMRAIPIPNEPALAGGHFQCQWLVVDRPFPLAPLRFVLTQGLEARMDIR
ncbi:MAG: FG-GAP repeat protein [Planctomycetes bacterium]|nr:FG-GAP repeat protein [Planctomycetota bacterium]